MITYPYTYLENLQSIFCWKKYTTPINQLLYTVEYRVLYNGSSSLCGPEDEIKAFSLLFEGLHHETSTSLCNVVTFACFLEPLVK